jgi:hypothetical protein
MQIKIEFCATGRAANISGPEVDVETRVHSTILIRCTIHFQIVVIVLSINIIHDTIKIERIGVIISVFLNHVRGVVALNIKTMLLLDRDHLHRELHDVRAFLHHRNQSSLYRHVKIFRQCQQGLDSSSFLHHNFQTNLGIIKSTHSTRLAASDTTLRVQRLVTKLTTATRVNLLVAN